MQHKIYTLEYSINFLRFTTVEVVSIISFLSFPTVIETKGSNKEQRSQGIVIIDIIGCKFLVFRPSRMINDNSVHEACWNSSQVRLWTVLIQ